MCRKCRKLETPFQQILIFSGNEQQQTPQNPCMKWLGKYSEGESYSNGDVVEYNGSFFLSIADNTLGDSPHKKVEQWNKLSSASNERSQLVKEQTATLLQFSTGEILVSNQFIGSASSSDEFIKNTVVCPFHCKITSIAFSIRELSLPINYTATIYINGNPTNSSATIINGSQKTGALVDTELIVGQLDLISIRITYPGENSLYYGASITLSLIKL